MFFKISFNLSLNYLLSKKIIFFSQPTERNQRIELDLTLPLKAEYLDAVFEKNLIQNIDLSNSDLLAIIYRMLEERKQLIAGKLVVYYT